jgi:UDP-glucose:(heptosyl)LPS alpha-1,3-glucosyltransferase
MVIGQDDARTFQSQARSAGVSDQVDFLGGRDDVPRFLLGADLLVHPAYNENTGTVLLEALVAGLPVVVTDVCGYAHYIEEADCGRVVPTPFQQRTLNATVRQILEDKEVRLRWHENALAFAARADLYSLPERAADVILGEMV